MIGNILWKVVTPGLLGLFLLILGYIAKKWLVPWLGSGIRLNIARHLLIVADDITDYYRALYPDKEWIEWFDEAVDKLIEVVGVKREIAQRVTRDTITRKGIGKGKKGKV